MRLINQTKNTVLAEDVCFALTAAQRLKGLLGAKVLKPGQALLIKPCSSIHTLFMRFPIDVLFVDRDNKAVKVISGLVPFCFSPIVLNSSFVVELPCGTLNNTSTAPGDQLTLQ